MWGIRRWKNQKINNPVTEMLFGISWLHFIYKYIRFKFK